MTWVDLVNSIGIFSVYALGIFWGAMLIIALYVIWLAIQERRIRKKNERALAAIRRAGEEFAKKYPPKGDRK